jgi:hypothetical protein
VGYLNVAPFGVPPSPVSLEVPVPAMVDRVLGEESGDAILIELWPRSAMNRWPVLSPHIPYGVDSPVAMVDIIKVDLITDRTTPAPSSLINTSPLLDTHTPFGPYIVAEAALVILMGKVKIYENKNKNHIYKYCRNYTDRNDFTKSYWCKFLFVQRFKFLSSRFAK